MANLFNFEFLFSDSANSNKLSKNQVNKKFDEFIKESFATYLYKSAIFKKYAKVYDQDSSFTNECADLYILSEQLYLNAIQKIKLPFDVKFNKTYYKISPCIFISIIFWLLYLFFSPRVLSRNECKIYFICNYN